MQSRQHWSWATGTLTVSSTVGTVLVQSVQPCQHVCETPAAAGAIVLACVAEACQPVELSAEAVAWATLARC